jgi:hypothetical protein
MSEGFKQTRSAGGAHPDLATHDALGLATDAELATHAAAADPHTGYVREADANWVDLTDLGETTLHTHPAGAGAPTDADYLVGTAHAGLSAEIVVGTSPGGELGGTWASPTVDATHSGSAHHTRAHAVDSASDHTAGTLGDLIYGAVAGAWTRLTGNITTTRKFLRQTGDGAASAAPVWDTLLDGDIPSTIARDTEVTTAVSDHAGAADPHTGYVREADANWIDLTDSGPTTLHSHAGGSGYNLVEDEGTPLTARTTINFVGAGVTASDDGSETVVTIAGGGSPAATTVEKDLGSTPTWRGKFTITDAAISGASKVLCWQAPGPYTGKGTRADEAEMQPVSVIAVVPAAGSAVVHWETPPLITMSLSHTTMGGLKEKKDSNVVGGLGQMYLDRYSGYQQVPKRLGKVEGNVKFSYVVFS